MANLFKNVKDILSHQESLFINPTALDFDYQPKLVPYRENQQRYIAGCINPLLLKRNGKNILVYGSPGVGKTVSAKHILKELEEQTDDVKIIYINCWKKDTSHKIVLDICDQINYKFTHNKTTEEIFKKISEILNKKSVVFVFDEVDKMDNYDLLYNIAEDIYRKTIILITNEENFLIKLDQRLKSRLLVESLEFKPYNLEETKGILQERIKYGFVANVFEKNAFDFITEKTFELKDIRSGLFLLRESGSIAEGEVSKKITLDYAKQATLKLNQFKIKDSADFKTQEKEILDLVKENSGKTVKELFDIYSNKNEINYRTFQRKIANLEKEDMVDTEEFVRKGGGRSNIVKFKKLDEF